MSVFEKYRPDNPVNKVKMTAAFAFAKPAHVLASFFGSGLIHPAPALGALWPAGSFLSSCSHLWPMKFGLF